MSMSMVATERLGRVTGWVGASGQTSAIGGQAIWQAATRVKLEQAPKVKSWMPTRPLNGDALRFYLMARLHKQYGTPLPVGKKICETVFGATFNEKNAAFLILEKTTI